MVKAYGCQRFPPHVARDLFIIWLSAAPNRRWHLCTCVKTASKDKSTLVTVGDASNDKNCLFGIFSVCEKTVMRASSVITSVKLPHNLHKGSLVLMSQLCQRHI